MHQGAFHGRTMGALALTASRSTYNAHFGPLMPGVSTTPYPYCLHCCTRPSSSSDALGAEAAQRCCNAPLSDLESLLYHKCDPSDTAAIVVEPIQVRSRVSDTHS